MKALLDDLCRIKQLREANALAEARKRRYRFEECVRARDRTEQELADFQAWRPVREGELFADIRRKPVVLKEVDDYKAAIGLLRERENLLAERSSEAEKALATAKEELAVAMAVHAAALKAKEKFAEFLGIQRREAHRLKEYREDLELEEFGGKPAFAAVEDRIDGDDDR